MLTNLGRPFLYLFLLIIFLISQTTLPKFSFPRLPRVHIPLFNFWPNFSLLCLLALCLAFYSIILKDLPSPKTLKDYQPKLTTQIFDRNGKLLYRLYQDENRTLVKLDEIPSLVRQATIAIEDKHFYQHQGVSLTGILRALERNLTTDKLEGGSTITQQLIKNTLLTNERTLTRKIKEVIIAVHTELIYGKDTILEMYLNQVPYGGTAYGIQAASQQYFGVDIKDLSLAQIALLAGLPQAPTYYSPYGQEPELTRARQVQVLNRMQQDGYISEEQYNQALNEKVAFSPPAIQILAPHFVMYVKELLVKQFGETLVNQGGLQVHTSLDLDLHNFAQNTVTTEVDKLKQLKVTNGAALIIDPKTGEILSMVGSRNYFDLEHDGQVNLTLRRRQPGSSVKPINYALAFEKGAKPSDMIVDTPITFYSTGSQPWSPKNYDNRFHGLVSLRNALGNSYNIPAVMLLANNGVSQMALLGTNMGITTWDDPTRFGLSFTLGAVEVRMLDLAKAYTTFANLGQTINLNPILSITDSQGNSIPFDNCQVETPSTVAKVQASDSCLPRQTITPQSAYYINDILSDRNARAAAFGYNSILNIPNHQVAVKTGTSNELKDNWTFGYTKDFLVATWVGNNDNTPMEKIASGITGASPIWAKIMTNLLTNSSTQTFDLPESLVKINICTLTNTLPCASCPNIRPELFLKGKEPATSCNDEQIKKIIEEKLKKELENSNKLTQQTISPHPQILEGAYTSR